MLSLDVFIYSLDVFIYKQKTSDERLSEKGTIP